MSLLGDIDTAVRAIWAASWNHPSVPVYWLARESVTLPDPLVTPHFVRNELLFGPERAIAFGGGRGANERLKYGSLIVRIFSDVDLRDDSVAMGLQSDAEAVFRSVRSGAISFIGGSSGYDQDTGDPPTDWANWSMRGSLLVWQYRFVG